MFAVVRPGPEHASFIEETFLRSVSVAWPWSLMSWIQLRGDFQRRTRRPECRVGVAVREGAEGSYLGWAAVCPLDNEVVYAYTIGAYRTKLAFEPRVATTLVTELGVDLTRPTTVRYWTPAAETLSKRSGYQLVPARGE